MPTAYDSVILHRCGFGPRAEDLIEAYEGGVEEASNVVGGKRPYHFVVDSAGVVTQCVALSKQGAHARSWNSRAVGVAMLGDFRHTAPAPEQWQAALNLVALLNEPTYGHDECPRATSDPNKQCPGALWDMSEFRNDLKGTLLGWQIRAEWLRQVIDVAKS